MSGVARGTGPRAATRHCRHPGRRGTPRTTRAAYHDAARRRAAEIGHPFVPPFDTRTSSAGTARSAFRIASRVVDEISSVSEQQLRDSRAIVATEEGLTIEGAAAAAVAYLRETAGRWHGKRVAALVTGNAIDPGTP